MLFEGLNGSAERILGIAVVTVFLWLLVNVFSKSLVNAVVVSALSGKRLKTLTSLVRAALSVFILVIGLFMVLGELGLNIGPLLASAGILGLAVGFGAQTLVKDVISGIFLLLEDQFDEGDEIEISGKKGQVAKITLRTVWLRDEEGAMHIIPNGAITLVSNFSKKKP
jgi:small conductance mechanosensitive channel